MSLLNLDFSHFSDSVEWQNAFIAFDENGEAKHAKIRLDNNSRLLFIGPKESGKTKLASLLKEWILEKPNGFNCEVVNTSDVLLNACAGIQGLPTMARDDLRRNHRDFLYHLGNLLCVRDKAYLVKEAAKIAISRALHPPNPIPAIFITGARRTTEILEAVQRGYVDAVIWVHREGHERDSTMEAEFKQLYRQLKDKLFVFYNAGHSIHGILCGIQEHVEVLNAS